MTLDIASNGPMDAQRLYRSRIEAVLRTIETTQTGRTILAHIRASAHWVRIVPFGQAQYEALQRRGRRGASAFAIAMNEAASQTFVAGDPAPGSNSMVHFTPGLVEHADPIGRDDVVLVHELSHALRIMRGLIRVSRDTDGSVISTPMPHRNVDEFFAMIIEGVHCSELGLRQRANMGRSDRGTPRYMHVRPYSTRLNEFRLSMPRLTNEIAEIPHHVAAFNPFRDVT